MRRGREFWVAREVAHDAHRRGREAGGREAGGREGGRSRGGHGRGGGWTQGELPDAGAAPAWVSARLPDGWFAGPPHVAVDRDEILVVGVIPSPPDDPAPGEAEAAQIGSDAAPGEAAAAQSGADAARAAAESGRISRFREETRDERIAIAREIQHRYGRTASWGVTCGETTELFTTVSAPVMTRLRQPERQVLDTLIDAGVARSRSDALAWCVRLVGKHSDEWLAGLREAMSEVERLRAAGPDRP